MNGIIAISKKDMPEIIRLFDDNFYFLTTYPNLVSHEELELFLIDYGKTFKIIENGNLIGLAFYKTFNDEDIFFKFRTKTMKEADIFLLKEFIGLITNEQKGVKRIQTSAFEFDYSERRFLNQARVPREAIKKHSAFKNRIHWDCIEYSLVQSEIREFIGSVNALEGENISAYADEVSIQRHEAKHNHYLEYIMGKQDMLAVLQNNLSEHSCSTIAHDIAAKRIFPFSLNMGDKTVGYVSLMDMDWENRNGRIVCGVYEEYIGSTGMEYIGMGLEKVLDFCRSSLDLKRVWGITCKSNLHARKLFEGLLELESTSSKKDILYYGHIFE